MPRLLLLMNHVLAAEPMAVQRLRPHAGKCIQLQLRDIPSMLSWMPADLTVTVTAAGLLEWQPAATERADLVATLDASNLAQTVADTAAGRRPRVEVAGDAALAADVNWLAEHLRWDLQDDLARLVGDGPAVQLVRMATMVTSGARDAMKFVAQTAASRSGPSAPMPAESPPR